MFKDVKAATYLDAGSPLEPSIPLQRTKVLRTERESTLRKLIVGTRLIAVPNGNKLKDWVIRRRASKSVMRGHDAVSETARVWAGKV